MNTPITKLFLAIASIIAIGFATLLLVATFNKAMANDQIQACEDKGGIYERGYCMPRDMTDAEIEYAKKWVQQEQEL